MTDDPYGETWVYESLVGAIPGLSLPDRTAVAVQFAAFEAAVLVLAAVYDRPDAVLPATVAVSVAAAGSWFMLDIAARARELPLPRTFRRLLFGSNVEVLLGVIAYAALVTYLVAVDPTLLTALLGPTPPPLAVFLLLMVAWDLCYRIGTGWWTAVVTFHATRRYDHPRPAVTEVRGVAGRTMAFALVQLALVPFLLSYPLLAVAVAGHVAAVGVVLALAVLGDRT